MFLCKFSSSQTIKAEIKTSLMEVKKHCLKSNKRNNTLHKNETKRRLDAVTEQQSPH